MSRNYQKKYPTFELFMEACERQSYCKENISINNGNSKTGRACLTLSFPYIVSCRADAPCKEACYCGKGPQHCPKVCGAYVRNLRIWNSDPVAFEEQLDAALIYNGLPLLRFFDAGDAPDEDFVRMMFRVARKHPKIKMMAFTKQYEFFNNVLDEEELPSNLCIRFSAWDKNWPVPNPHNLPMSYVDFHENSYNPKIPENAFLCRGGITAGYGITCSTCQACFNKKIRAIRLKEH